jgi:hypothetical protein
MASFTGDKEWRAEDVPPSLPDAPLPGLWVRAWRDAEPVASGPSWRFATPAQAAAARAEADAIVAWRNACEALTAESTDARHRPFADLVAAVMARRAGAVVAADAGAVARLDALLRAAGVTVEDGPTGATWRRVAGGEG